MARLSTIQKHAMLRLGNFWWIAVKNLALASWNAVGNVD